MTILNSVRRVAASLNVDSIVSARHPADEDINKDFIMFRFRLGCSSSIPVALSACLDAGTNARLNSCYMIALSMLKNDLPLTEDNISLILNFSKKSRSRIPGGFHELVRKFILEFVLPESKNFFHIGERWVSHDEVCSSLSPSDNDRAATYWVFGVCLDCGLSVFDSLRIASMATTDSWMLMLLSLLLDAVILGENPAAVKKKIENFELERIKKSQSLGIPELSNLVQVGNTVSRWYLPNFMHAFSFDLSILSNPRLHGALPNQPFDLAKKYGSNKNGGYPTSKPWSAEVSQFLRILKSAQDGGNSILQSLSVILLNPQLSTEFADELCQITKQVEVGATTLTTLSEACRNVEGQLSHPVITALFFAAESCSDMKKVLEYLVK